MDLGVQRHDFSQVSGTFCPLVPYVRFCFACLTFGRSFLRFLIDAPPDQMFGV